MSRLSPYGSSLEYWGYINEVHRGETDWGCIEGSRTGRYHKGVDSFSRLIATHYKTSHHNRFDADSSILFLTIGEWKCRHCSMFVLVAAADVNCVTELPTFTFICTHEPEKPLHIDEPFVDQLNDLAMVPRGTYSASSYRKGYEALFAEAAVTELGLVGLNQLSDVMNCHARQ
uniref:Uncharacterized protein n=1 Tax=Plectus sambesii TaxID=2011161 RepID=A0A914UXD2_9BILA